MLWHTQTVLHLPRAAQGPALSVSPGPGLRAGALALAQPFGNIAPGPGHVLPVLAVPVNPAGPGGMARLEGSARPPKYRGPKCRLGARRSCRRLSVLFGRSRVPGAVLGPDGAGARGPSCGPAAPRIVRRDPPPCARPVQPRPSLPPSSGRPCPSPLFSPKANGDEMPRVGPGRARRGRSVRPQSPPPAR